MSRALWLGGAVLFGLVIVRRRKLAITAATSTATGGTAPTLAVTAHPGGALSIGAVASGVDSGTTTYQGDPFGNRAGRAGGSTLTQVEVDSANADPVWMDSNSTSYTAGQQLADISAGAKKVPVVGGLLSGAVNALNAGLSTLAGLVGNSQTNVALDYAVNSNAHGIVPDMPERPRGSSLVFPVSVSN